MAQRRRKRSNTHDDEFPGWVWMLFGLAIGLAVAFAVYVNGRTDPPAVVTAARQPVAAPQSNIDRNAETGDPGEETESRFSFYDMLPAFEVVIPESEPDVVRDNAPRAIVEPGEYVLQAGSFTRFEDADRRRAELALQGIESTIQRVAIDDRTYHRVRIGPTRDLDLLNQQRARLRAANIDVLRIRLGN